MSHTPTPFFFFAAALGIFIPILLVVSDLQELDEQKAHNTYCDMVRLWDQDAALGIRPDDRRGWPAFKGRKGCEADDGL